MDKLLFFFLLSNMSIFFSFLFIAGNEEVYQYYGSIIKFK